ncbi:MAG: MATE family efflux transporter, partial [Pseudothermotoga sp.]
YWRTFFMPVFFATYSTYTAQRMTGESRLPMMIMGTSAILNVILDPIFMFDRVPGLNLRGFNMGVSGAAVATVISTVVAFSWGFVVLLRGRGMIKIRFSGLFKLDREIDLKLLTIGLPSGIEMLMRSLSSAVLTKVLSLYGSSTLAVIGVVSRLMGLAFVPLMGFSMGASAIVGQNLGANKVQRAERTVFLAALYGSLFVLVFVLLANFYPETIMNLFVHEKDVIREGISAVRIGSWAMLIAAFSISLMSSFFGAGYTLPAMISSIIGRWAAQLPYVILVVVFLRLPTTYIWFSFIVAEVAELLYALFVFSKGRWKEYRVR